MAKKPMLSSCHHEAGHAVMAVALHKSVHRAAVVAVGHRLGYVETYQGGLSRFDPDRRNVTPAQRERLEERINVLLAGIAAEKHWYPRAHRNGFGVVLSGRDGFAGDGSDLKQALFCAEFIAGDEGPGLEKYLDWRFEVASQALNPWWPSVEAVAEELHNKGTLSGDTIKRIILTARGVSPDFFEAFND